MAHLARHETKRSFSAENKALPPRFQVAARSASGRSSVPGMPNRIGAAAFEVPERHLHAAQLLFGNMFG